MIDDQISCIWATAFNDELIWREKDKAPSLYIHRIATQPNFRGQNLTKQIVRWTDNYCKNNNLNYLRMDTVGLNKGLIEHYKKIGFNFLGTKELANTANLPEHYKDGPVILFQRVVQ